MTIYDVIEEQEVEIGLNKEGFAIWFATRCACCCRSLECFVVFGRGLRRLGLDGRTILRWWWC